MSKHSWNPVRGEWLGCTHHQSSPEIDTSQLETGHHLQLSKMSFMLPYLAWLSRNAGGVEREHLLGAQQAEWLSFVDLPLNNLHVSSYVLGDAKTTGRRAMGVHPSQV